MNEQPEGNGEQRSQDACPRCGEHRLALLDLPATENPLPYEPANELFGMGTDLQTGGSPAIGCLHCGAEWADLAAFRAEQAGVLPGDT